MGKPTSLIASLFSGDFKLIDHDKIEWIKIDDIKRYDFAPADKEINDFLIKNGI